MARILVIENEASIRTNLVRFLKLENFDVVAAEDGTQGLALAKAQRPDLVLCDLLMPGMDGDAVLASLRSEASTPLDPPGLPDRQRRLLSAGSADSAGGRRLSCQAGGLPETSRHAAASPGRSVRKPVTARVKSQIMAVIDEEYFSVPSVVPWLLS